MSGPRAIDRALDLARMPALAVAGPAADLPADLLDVMRIAAAQSEACREAEERTGKSPDALIEAARFYLQQTLFQPQADAFRVLGLAPGASRAAARLHMSCLLQWLHPDRNSGLDAVYAERVLRAWRDIANLPDGEAPARAGAPPYPGAPRSAPQSRRAGQIPWVAASPPARRSKRRRRMRRLMVRAAAVAAVIGIGVVLAELGGIRVDKTSFEAMALHLPIRLSLP